MYKHVWYCRWCGNTYTPVKQTDRDGFCKSSCKQAHYRAYKKYVTAKGSNAGSQVRYRVTQKKRKKRK